MPPDRPRPTPGMSRYQIGIILRDSQALALPGHFKLGFATSICPPTDVVRGGDGRSRWHRKRSRSLAGAVFGGARAQEAAELGTAVPARAAGPERAQEPAADGGQPGAFGP